MFEIFDKKYRNIYFIGIGGIGMSGIAEFLLHKGFGVKGSDLAKSEITERLEKLGAVIFEGHSAENIRDCDLIVYSSAVHSDNPELLRAAELGIKSVKRSVILGEITKGADTIGIAGTHGKTTTTAMLGIIMQSAGLNPTVFVGGRIPEFQNTNVVVGGGDLIIVEADEYDRTFLKLKPTTAVINNIEAEHLDIYKDFEDVQNTFIQFAEIIPETGFIALNADNEGSAGIKDKLTCRVIAYGLKSEADVRAVNIRTSDDGTVYDINYKGEVLFGMEIGVFGTHNVTNSLAALTIALERGIEFNKLKTSLKNFRGAERRFQILYSDEIKIIDDYAHHPSEVKASLEAVSKFRRRIIAVFQPHLFSRTRDFYKEFAEVFADYADVFICLDVYPAREEPIEGVSGKLIVDEIGGGKTSKKIFVNDKSEAIDIIENEIRNGDIIIFMGAGDITEIAHKLTGKFKVGEMNQ